MPAHVNEGTEPVDNLGGVLSVLLVGALVIGINFAAVPSSGEIIAITAGITIVAGVAFVLRQRRAATRSTTWTSPGAGSSGSRRARASSSSAR